MPVSIDCGSRMPSRSPLSRPLALSRLANLLERPFKAWKLYWVTSPFSFSKISAVRAPSASACLSQTSTPMLRNWGTSQAKDP